MTQGKIDKRVGGMKRAAKAREYIRSVLDSETHPMRYAKDIDFARKFDVSRHTIYSIRDELGMESRSDRLAKRLTSMKTDDKTLGELCAILNVKYAGLYKIMTENELPFKSDLKQPSRVNRSRES